MSGLLSGLWRDDEGVSSIEYALLLAALGVGTLGGVLGLVEKVSRVQDLALEPMTAAAPMETRDAVVVGVLSK